MKWFRDLSIKHKFILITLFTSGVSLAFASVAVVIFDTQAFKQSMAKGLASQADILALNSAAALTFEDHASAKQTLDALRATPHVMTGYILGRDGEAFASYVRPDLDLVSESPLLRREGHKFFPDRLALRRAVILEGDTVGAVYIEADLAELEARVKRYTGMAVSVAACAMILVLLLSSLLQKALSAPLLSLAATAKKISRNKNYSVRATKTANDEIGTLIDGFNAMLAQIQDRDAKLEDHRSRLENDVALRTAELRHVNERLKQSEGRMRAIVEGTSATTGAEFFDALAITLARALNTRWVMVGRLVGDDTIEAQALWDGTHVQRGLTYSLAGTPCEHAINESFCVYEDDVGEKFPEDEMLREWDVRSYAGVVLRDSNGKTIGILNAFHDQPLPELARDGSLLRVFASRSAAELERMMVGEELFKSESRTRAILDSAADGIITVGEDGSVESVNTAAEQIFGHLGADIVGRSVATLMRSPDARQDAVSPDGSASLLARFVGRRGEIEGLRSDGSAFAMNIVASEMKLVGKTSYTAIVRDVTRERELERMKSDFVSTVSHEIRTPLSCIISSAKILLKNGETKPEVTNKFSTIIADEAKRLSRLINDLLDLSKMDAGGLDWTFKEASPAELLRHVVSLSMGDARKRGVSLEMADCAEVPDVKVDRNKFVKVLTNLVSNAIKFTPGGGRIELTAEAHGADYVCISVKDNGIGIDARDQQVIFDRFKQIGDVLTDRPQGSGLGLPICKEIVETLGGEIWVESTRGHGSTFRFTVPAARPKSEQHSETGNGDAAGALVLVVDDDPATREVVAYLLTSHGFEVVEAGCGKDAIDLAKEHHPSLITLDIMMPDLSGYDVLAHLRQDEELKDTPILLMSVLSGSTHSDRGLQLGANAFLNKPVDEATLLATAKRLVGSHGTRVLLVSDESEESSLVRSNLKAQGYAVLHATDATSGMLSALEEKPDLVIVGSPGSAADGDVLLERLRADERTASIPILLLTGVQVDGVNAVYLDPSKSDSWSVHSNVDELLSSFVRRYATAGNGVEDAGDASADASADTAVE